MSNMKLREIERLRAIAVLMVIFTHTGPAIGKLGNFFGHPRTGVDLFFVISGFVVTRSLGRLLPDLTRVTELDVAFEQCRSALRVFYTRRFFRIVPLVVGTLVFQRMLFFTGLQPSDLGGDLNGYWREVSAIFTGVYNYAQANEGYSQFGVFWSLSVEEHFYLLLPLSFLLMRTRAKRIGFALAGIAFVALVCRNFFDAAPPGTAQPEYYSIFASHLRFDALLAGVALSLLLEQPPATPIMPPRFMKWVVLPICLALVCAIPRVLPNNAYLHEGFIATWFLCSVLVGYASFDQGYVFGVPLLGGFLEYLGARSYALYLLHIPTVRLASAIALHQPGYAQFRVQYPVANWFAYLFVVLALSELSWRLLEWPMQKLGRRLTNGAIQTRALVANDHSAQPL